MLIRIGRSNLGLFGALCFVPFLVFAQTSSVADLERQLAERTAAYAARIERLRQFETRITEIEAARLQEIIRIAQLERIADQNITLKGKGNIELERQMKLKMAEILSHDPKIIAGENLPLPIETSYTLYESGRMGGGGETIFKGGSSRIITSMIGDSETLLEDCAPHEAAHTLHVRICGRIKIPRWVNEGLATLEERPSSIQRLVYDQLKDRPLPQLSELLAVKEYPKEVETFYAHGAAFSAFLLSRLQGNLPSVTDREARFMVLAFSLVADDKGYSDALKQYKAQLGMQSWNNADLVAKTEQEFREWLYQKTHK